MAYTWDKAESHIRTGKFSANAATNSTLIEYGDHFKRKINDGHARALLNVVAAELLNRHNGNGRYPGTLSKYEQNKVVDYYQALGKPNPFAADDFDYKISLENQLLKLAEDDKDYQFLKSIEVSAARSLLPKISFTWAADILDSCMADVRACTNDDQVLPYAKAYLTWVKYVLFFCFASNKFISAKAADQTLSSATYQSAARSGTGFTAGYNATTDKGQKVIFTFKSTLMPNAFNTAALQLIESFKNRQFNLEYEFNGKTGDLRTSFAKLGDSIKTYDVFKIINEG